MQQRLVRTNTCPQRTRILAAEFAVKRILIEGKEVSLPSIRISAGSGPNRAATVGSRESTGG